MKKVEKVQSFNSLFEDLKVKVSTSDRLESKKQAKLNIAVLVQKAKETAKVLEKENEYPVTGSLSRRP